MPKCKIIRASNRVDLESKINTFIEDKKVISISMEIRQFHYANNDVYYACIIYENWSE